MSLVKINKDKRFLQFFAEVKENRKIDFLVLHHIEANNLDHAITQLVEHEVSSHFIIDEEGAIYELVAANNIAYHAGISFWNGVDGLNQHSIGIEFVTKDAFRDGYRHKQMQAGAKLCQALIAQYRIMPQNIVAHSDIAYFNTSGLLDRKQDPSHLFDWKLMHQHHVGLYPDIVVAQDEVIFTMGDKSSDIAQIKKSLANFGYKVSNFHELFDEEMRSLIRVFHRRFNQTTFQTNPDIFYKSSQLILQNLSHALSN